MNIELKHDCVLISRGENGKRCGKESTLWHWLRNYMKGKGYNAVRWNPYKTPGHLTSMPFALKYKRDDRTEWIVDNFYAIRDPAKQYNEGLTVRFEVVRID